MDTNTENFWATQFSRLELAISENTVAIREHTAHVKRDDERYWDEKGQYTEEDTTEEQPKTVFTSAGQESWFNSMMDKYFGPREKLAVNMNYSSQHPDTGDRTFRTDVEDPGGVPSFAERRITFNTRRPNEQFPLNVPEEIRFVLRETLHEYRRPPRAKYQSVASKDCELCGLTLRNPVHSVRLSGGDEPNF